MTKAKKPPTQVAGVKGIEPNPVTLTPEPSNIDWSKITELPSFQMFAVECEPKLYRALEYRRETNHRVLLFQDCELVRAWMAQYEPDDLYKQYAEWHLAKGYWPNETPCGELIISEA